MSASSPREVVQLGTGVGFLHDVIDVRYGSIGGANDPTRGVGSLQIRRASTETKLFGVVAIRMVIEEAPRNFRTSPGAN